jgi:hypothetical protein
VTAARRRRREVAGALVLAALVGGAYAAASAAAGPGGPGPARTGHGGTATPTGGRSSSPPRPAAVRLPVGTIGRYRVARQSLTLTERSGAGPRVIQTVVRYPAIPPRAAGAAPLARGQFPLLVFAPGYLQCDGSYASLLRTWASAGYVVAGIEFPVTSCRARGPESDLVNQPRDMAFVIRQLLGISGRRHGALAGLVNPARIAVAGHSDGGDTVAALVGNTCCLDHKVVAAIVLAGAEWPAMRGTYFPGGTPPILFVQGSADPINPPPASLQMYRADTGTRFYLDLYGASHLPPYEGSRPPEPIVARVTTEFLNRYVAGQQAAGAAMARAGNVPGTARLVHGGRLPS